MQQEDESPKGDVWEDLILAMLSVGGYPVDKVLIIRVVMKRVGLLDPHNLAAWDEARVTRELNSAGYSRGLLIGMYAERLVATFRSLTAEHFAETQTILENGNPVKVSEVLLPQYGIGPKVVDIFLSLRHRR